jgi:hypothetical protein
MEKFIRMNGEANMKFTANYFKINWLTSWLILASFALGQDLDTINQNSEDTISKTYEKPRVYGYVKYLPSYRTNSDFSVHAWDHLIHNRMNLDWKISNQFVFHGALRTRFFGGYTIENFPGFGDFLAQDQRLIDASFVLYDGNKSLLHTTSDRFFLDYHSGKWHVRLGRQRVNWGINMVSNPNDLFNTYSFFDFDYEERPGTDALRVQYFLNATSRAEIVWSPGRKFEESVIGGLFGFNFKSYDLQFVGGYFHNRLALGTGWAGNIKQLGFKGEIGYFHDLEELVGVDQKWNIVGAVSFDYMFGNSSFLVAEYLFNQQRDPFGNDVLFFTQPLRADNLSFFEHSALVNYAYPINMVFSVGSALIYYPTESGVFLSPNIRYSLRQNLDLMFVSQLFFGPDESFLSQAGYLGALWVKWSF